MSIVGWRRQEALPRLRRVSPLRDLLRASTLSLVEDGRVHPARAGRLLLLTQTIFVAATAPLLGPSRPGWIALASVALGMGVVVAAGLRFAWARRALVFPIATVLAIAALGAADPATFAPVSGYLTLTFVYLGVTSAARDAVIVLPMGAVALALTYGDLSGPVIVRLMVITVAWLTTAGVLSWITRRHLAATSALRGAAHVDQLTGVPNRRDLDLHLAVTSDADTIVVIDLDHFKVVNDTFGHAGGDRVLEDFGALLRAELRGADYCARFGGEEFVVIVAGAGRKGHQPLIDRMREHWALLQPDVTFSTGTAACAPGRDARDTLALADEALYAAKAAGRNTDRTHHASFRERYAPDAKKGVAYVVTLK